MHFVKKYLVLAQLPGISAIRMKIIVLNHNYRPLQAFLLTFRKIYNMAFMVLHMDAHCSSQW